MYVGQFDQVVYQCKRGCNRITVSVSECQSMWNQSLPLCECMYVFY